MKKRIVWSTIIMCACTLPAFGQNKVLFDNQSGEVALVKLIGPTQTVVEVPTGAKVGTDAAAGKYIVKVRYGTPGNYRYSQGQDFEVTETASGTTETTITLHKVVAGNYETHPISESEFGAAGAERAVPRPSTMAKQEGDVRPGEKQLVKLLGLEKYYERMFTWPPPTPEDLVFGMNILMPSRVATDPATGKGSVTMQWDPTRSYVVSYSWVPQDASKQLTKQKVLDVCGKPDVTAGLTATYGRVQLTFDAKEGLASVTATYDRK